MDVMKQPSDRWARHGSSAEAVSDQSVAELVKNATEQLSELVRQELRLAVAEMKDKGRHAGIGAGMFGGAALIALYGAGAVLIAAIAALALVLPVWASALIIGVALLIVAAVLALTGRNQVTRATPPLPDQTLDNAKQDVSEIAGRTHR
jgi:hypothetical protein